MKKKTSPETKITPAFSALDLENGRKHSIDNEIEIVTSKKCGCFFCRHTYDARKVQDWIDDDGGVTALCPECGMDAVIGDVSNIDLSKEYLKAMNLAYFGPGYMKSHPSAARVYCQRYIDGKITSNAKNETLFCQYLKDLTLKGDPEACLRLADIYHYGGKFISQDPELSKAFYLNPLLKNSPKALCHLGCLLYEQANCDGDRASYECFSRACALGSLEAVYRLADCYLYGRYVDKDPEIGFGLLSSAFNESFTRFSVDHIDWYDFPDFAYRLGICYQKGLGTPLDCEEALKMFLLAEFSFSLRNTFEENERFDPIFDDIEKQVETLAKAFHFKRQDPIFDADTFYASFSGLENSEENKTFSLSSFDKESGDLSFDVSYELPQLIIDLGSLYVGFVSGTIRWDFHQVADFKLSSHDQFNKIKGNNEDGWSFVHSDALGNEDTICELRFFSELPKKSKKIG